MVNSNNDWRIRGQEASLRGKTFIKREFQPWPDSWDHEHCGFCFEKFAKLLGVQYGYAALDSYDWVCEACYSDFKEMFDFHDFNSNAFHAKSLRQIFKQEIGLFRGQYELYEIRRVMNLLVLLSDIAHLKEMTSLEFVFFDISPTPQATLAVKRMTSESPILFYEARDGLSKIEQLIKQLQEECKAGEKLELNTIWARIVP